MHSLVALDEAKKAADDENLDAAIQALVEARDAAPDALLAELAMIRLAKVQYAQGNAEEALQTLQGVRNLGISVLGIGTDRGYLFSRGQFRAGLRRLHQRFGWPEGDANRPCWRLS